MVHMVNLLITMYMEEGMLQETVTVVRLRTFHSTFLDMDGKITLQLTLHLSV